MKGNEIMEMSTDIVQNQIMDLESILKFKKDHYSNEDLYIKKIIERRPIFSKNLTLTEKLFYEVDKFLNSFSSSSLDDKEKIAIIIIKMMILKKKKKENNWAADDFESIIDLYNDKVEKILNHLLDKNRKYGNSALNPVRIISSENTVEQLYIRIDDKLNRVLNRQNDEDEDLPFDIAGYFILVLIYYKLSKIDK